MAQVRPSGLTTLELLRGEQLDGFVADPLGFGGELVERDVAVAPAADRLLDVAGGVRRLRRRESARRAASGRRCPDSRRFHQGTTIELRRVIHTEAPHETQLWTTHCARDDAPRSADGHFIAGAFTMSTNNTNFRWLRESGTPLVESTRVAPVAVFRLPG